VSRLRRGSTFRTGARRGGFSAPQQALVAEPGAVAEPPSWPAVQTLVERLADTGAVFATTTSPTNWISSYEPGRRFMLQTDDRSSWVHIENLRACWEIFEQLGRITRKDVLEPGRCSAVVLALFGQIPGVVHEQGPPAALRLPGRPGSGSIG
jgi:hypothetical protein